MDQRSVLPPRLRRGRGDPLPRRYRHIGGRGPAEAADARPHRTHPRRTAARGHAAAALLPPATPEPAIHVMTAEYDAIVIGGGPSGSTTAALLAEYGHKVLLLEREPMPRYHIGESLIPYTWFTLNRLGLVEKMRQSANPKKYSVQFVSITGKVSQPFYFFQTIQHECSVTWQVVRSEFDKMLLDNAREKGAEIRQGVSVRDVLMEGARVVGVRCDEKDG